MRRKFLFISSVTLLFLTIPHTAYADVSAQLKEAGTLVKNKQYEQAEAIYQQIVTAFPDTNEALEAQKQLTLVYIDTDKQQEADAAFKKLLADFSKHEDIAKAVWQIGQKYIELKKYEKAFELNQYNVDHFPRDMHAMWSQVEIIYSHLREGNDAGADAVVSNLLTVFSEQPTLPKEIHYVANKYGELKKYDKAFELYQYNVEHFPKSEYAMWSQSRVVRSHIRDGNELAADEAFKKLLTVFSDQPTLPKEIWQIGQRYIELKKYDKAFELNQYNVDHFPRDIHAMWSQVEIVSSYIRDGNDAAADAAVSNLLTIFSKQATLPKEIWQIAKKYDELKKYDKAFRLYQYSVEHFPHAMWSQVEIVKSHIRDANETAADEAFKKLLTVFSNEPNLPKGIYQVADAYSKAKRYNKANQLYQYVIDSWLGTEDAMWAKANMAKLNIALGNEAAAEAVVNELIADFNDEPNLPQAIFQIGEEYYNKAFQYQNKDSNDQAKERFHKAIAVSERIIKELPQSPITPEAYILSGECYRHLGQHQNAMEYYQKVVSDWPDCEYAWYAYLLIGCTYEQLRDSGVVEKSLAYTQIRAAYERILQNYPDCPAAGAARMWLSCYVKSSQGGQK